LFLFCETKGMRSIDLRRRNQRQSSPKQERIRSKSRTRSLSRGRASDFLRSSSRSRTSKHSKGNRSNTTSSKTPAAFSVADVTVTVLQLSGLTCKVLPKKKSFLKSQHNHSQNNAGDGAVVSAVASFARNAFSSDTNIMTHVPSFPLLQIEDPDNENAENTKSKSQLSKYKASWPASDRRRDKDDINHSSFTFSRVLKQDATGAFESELVDLSIGLFKGTELITLGCATMVVSVDAPQTTVKTKTNLVVRNEEMPVKFDTASRARSKKTTTSTKTIGKKIKYACFPSESTRRYSIANNAILAVEMTVSLSNPTNSHSFHKRQYKNVDPGLQIPAMPIKFIYPDGQRSFQDLRTTSTMTESTKSGYLVTNNSFSHSSPTGVVDFNSHSQKSKKKSTFAFETASCSFFEFFCCMPDASFSLDDDNDLYETNENHHSQNHITEDYPTTPIKHHMSPIQRTPPPPPPQPLLPKATNTQRHNQNNNIDASLQKHNIIYYSPQEWQTIAQSKAKLDTLPQNEKDDTSVTSQTVNSIERATETLHHYAQKLGMKVEDLL